MKLVSGSLLGCLLGILGVLAIGATGCGAEATDAAGVTAQPVIGGTETDEAPEVGIVNFDWGSYCTATLISPRVAITAAHCVEYASRDVTGDYGSFRIDQANGSSSWYTVDRYRAFLRDGLGSPDVALLRLHTAVPATVAKPARVATSKPSNGTSLTLYGYGCNDDWEHQTGGGTKRKLGFSYGQTLVTKLCPGDSGGPVRVNGTGEVLLINSGWESNWLGDKHDVFGETPQYVSKINAQTSAWAASDPTTGLTAQYYDAKDLSGEPKMTRYDATVDFDWQNGSPQDIVESDTFSVRWSGKIEPLATETYTLEVYSDDGARLYIDDQLVIDGWSDHSAASQKATVAFTASQLRSLRLEYYENGGGATAKLFWSSPSTPRQIVPAARLRP